MGADYEARKLAFLETMTEIIEKIKSGEIVVHSASLESRLEDNFTHGTIERHDTGHRKLTVEYQEIND